MFRRTVLHLSTQTQRTGVTIMRLATIVPATLLSSGGLCAAQSAQAVITYYELNIPRQPLDTALKQLAQQTGLQVGRFSDAINGDIIVGPISGNYSAEEALKTLLAHTRLTYRTINDRAIIVLRSEDITQMSPANSHSARTLPGQADSEGGENSSATSQQKSLWDRFRLAQTTPRASAETASVEKESAAQTSDKQSVRLEEVVVTAQKRAQRLQDVPGSVTAINAESLVDSNLNRLEDYASTVPGLTMNGGTGGNNGANLAIRGLFAGTLTNPTVGVVIDDVPFGASTFLGGNNFIPDFDPGDLARIEVLRGPQGTLYGANSIGGLIKYVTVDPSTTGSTGYLSAGFSGVHNGADLGYMARGGVNLSINETLAIRLSGFSRLDPGYIDDPALNQRGVNKTEAYGGLAALLWRPSKDFSVKLLALLQDSHQYGSDFSGSESGGLTLGGLQQSLANGSGWERKSTQAYIATVTGNAGGVEITSITGYSRFHDRALSDFTPVFGGIASALFPGTSSATLYTDFPLEKFSQELRFSGSIANKMDWFVGGLYTHEYTPQYEQADAVDPSTGHDVGEIALPLSTDKLSERAAFADVTYHFTDQFDIQVGARESHIVISYDNPAWLGPFDPLAFNVPSPLLPPSQSVTNSAFTYLITPQFKISSDFMVYARLASGYRPGGANSNTTTHEIPPYGPDTTKNYELGAKFNILDHRLAFDASLYYIDWKDIQINAVDPVTHTTDLVNAGNAKSQGAELSVESTPVPGLRVSGWVSINDAILTRAFPSGSTVYTASGDRLPFSARYSGNFAVEKSVALGSGAVSVGGNVSYISDRSGIFQPTPARAYLPGYALAALHAGVNIGSWKVNVFVNNLFDRRGVVDNGLDSNTHVFGVWYVQPRTIGTSFRKEF